MVVVLFGASGGIGRYVDAELRRRGVDVVAAQRSSGVDAYAGTGLDAVCDGAQAVIDCTNITTMRASRAIDFFGTVAANIADAATRGGVPRVVCLSIVNAAEPRVNAKFGYYQGKARQEQVYRDRLADGVLTVVASAQWYELGEQLLAGARLGPVAFVPHMRCRPMAATDAARLLVDVALGPPAADVEIAGPAELDIVTVAKAIAAQTGSPRWVAGIAVGGSAIRTGGLLPAGDYRQGDITLAAWLADRSDSQK